MSYSGLPADIAAADDVLVNVPPRVAKQMLHEWLKTAQGQLASSHGSDLSDDAVEVQRFLNHIFPTDGESSIISYVRSFQTWHGDRAAARAALLITTMTVLGEFRSALQEICNSDLTVANRIDALLDRVWKKEEASRLPPPPLPEPLPMLCTPQPSVLQTPDSVGAAALGKLDVAGVSQTSLNAQFEAVATDIPLAAASNEDLDQRIAMLQQLADAEEKQKAEIAALRAKNQARKKKIADALALQKEAENKVAKAIARQKEAEREAVLAKEKADALEVRLNAATDELAKLTCGLSTSDTPVGKRKKIHTGRPRRVVPDDEHAVDVMEAGPAARDTRVVGGYVFNTTSSVGDVGYRTP